MVTNALGTRPLAGSHPQQQLENLLTNLRYGSLPIGNTSRIHIHVVAHAAKHVGIAGNFQHWNIGETNRAAPAGRKGDQVRAARGESCDRDRIVTRCIHKQEARGLDAF